MSAMSGAAARDERGKRILVVSWAANALFAVTAIPAALGVSAFDVPAIVVALGLFAISLGVWCWAFAVALARTTRGDDVVVASMFLVQGPAPKRVRVQLFGSLAVCVAVTAVTAVAEPFGILVPMLPLGLLGLWGARHGVFPPRRMPDATTRDKGARRSSGRAGE
ncbi:MAG TPA: hypothetical protein VHY55_02400 [Acidimicrobiia bacterium]|nr:hypothetical protein [Acidimicrobiia bacterium]